MAKLRPGRHRARPAPSGKPIWVAGETGAGGAGCTMGGVFSNDELSEEFLQVAGSSESSTRSCSGGWRSDGRVSAGSSWRDQPAAASLRVDLAAGSGGTTGRARRRPGQGESANGDGMQGADLAMYQRVEPPTHISRTGVGLAGRLCSARREGGPVRLSRRRRGPHAVRCRRSTSSSAATLCWRIAVASGRPSSLAWCRGSAQLAGTEAVYEVLCRLPRTRQWPAGHAARRPRVEYFEIMNEPDLHPATGRHFHAMRISSTTRAAPWAAIPRKIRLRREL